MRQLKITQQITSRESISLVKYLHEVGSISLIDQEEEVRLAELIQSEDKKISSEALNKLVESNLRFVISVAKQYQTSGASLDDLISAGNLGLIEAARRFDHSRGFKFISYAVWWIRQSVLQYISENNKGIRIPLNKTGLINKVRKSITKLEQVLERTPSLEEISLDLAEKGEKMTPTDIETLIISNSPLHSLDMKLNEESEMNLLDVIQTETLGDINKSLKTEDLQGVLKRVIDKKLSFRERDVLVLYFGLFGGKETSLEEIGRRFDLTRERVRQIKEKSLRKLRSPHGRKIIKELM